MVYTKFFDFRNKPIHMAQTLSHADFKVIIKLFTEKMEAFSDPLQLFFPLFTNRMRMATMKNFLGYTIAMS